VKKKNIGINCCFYIYNNYKMAVHDFPEIEKETRELQRLRKIKNKNDDKSKFVKFLNKKNNNIYSDESSHFANIIGKFLIIIFIRLKIVI